jgi:peptide/nickel transport system permease protein
MAMNILYAWMGWFPPERLSIWAVPVVQAETFTTYTGMYTVDALINGNWEIFVDALRHLVLPGLTLSIVAWALFTRVMRDSLLEELHRDYITTARAKGLREGRIIRVHARHNAILPVISTTGTAMSVFLGTIVVAETLFSFNGIGRWAAMAIIFSDVPAAVGFTLFTAIAVVLSSLAADVLYAIVDPRVRLD